MGIKLWVMLVMMVLSLLNGWYCLGYWEEERVALLHLKANMNFPDGRSLHSWVVNEIGTDCCQWQGVECSNTTKREIQIMLDDARDWKLGDWYFNASLFRPFQELRNLSLSNNQLVGWIENEGHESLFGLTKLEVLDLGSNDWFSDNNILSVLNLNDFINLKELDICDNGFGSLGTIYGLKILKVLNLQSNYFNNNSIFSSLHGLSSLKSLDLSRNKLKRTIQMKDLHALSDLEELVLSYNEVENFTTLAGIKSMHRLQVLKLNDITVSNISNMVQSLRPFSYLKHFYFQSNYANGSIGSYELRHLRWLEGLYLDDSAVDGNFLRSIGALTSLKILSLSRCRLNGTLPVQELRHLRRLEGLFLDDSIVDWNILQSIGALTSLKILSLSDCRLNGNLPVQGLCKLKNLQELDLSWNEYEGKLPSYCCKHDIF